MSYKSIRIIGICLDVDLFKFASLFNEYVVDFEINDTKVINKPVLGVESLTLGGLSSSEYIEGIKNELGDSVGEELCIILTSQPILGLSRFHVTPDKKYILITCHNLRGKFGTLPIYRSLVYVSLLIYKNEGLMAHEGEFCISNSKAANSYIVESLCTTCKNKLTNYGRQESHILDTILLDDHFDNGIHVIIMHGMMSYGTWTHKIQDHLRRKKFSASIAGYGFFSIFKFIFNTIFTKKIARLLYDEYSNVISKKRDHKISILAHSHGALAVCKCLEKFDIKLDKIIFIGAAAPNKFDWVGEIHSGKVNRILNECGDGDYIAALAQLIPGSGSAGAHFFHGPGNNSDNVINVRYQDSSHSSLLSTRHCDASWINFLLSDTWEPQQNGVEATMFVRLLGYKVF